MWFFQDGDHGVANLHGEYNKMHSYRRKTALQGALYSFRQKQKTAVHRRENILRTL